MATVKDGLLHGRCQRACESCKRRKEKCDGAKPCARCIRRKVSQQCRFPAPAAKRLKTDKHSFVLSEDMDCFEDAELAIENHINKRTRSEPIQGGSVDDSPASVVAAPIPHMSRLLRADDGRFIFIGDSSNLSLLQNIRKLVERAIGPCRFTNDPSRYIMVETVPPEHQNYKQRYPRAPTQKPDVDTTRRLVDQFRWATHCLLDVLTEHEEREDILQWQSLEEDDFDDPSSAKYFLTLAIGAQVGLEDQDSTAEAYFNTGRCLTGLHHVDRPSLVGVQCHLLITLYLLGAARRNAAAVNFGNAVQAAYAIGLHLREVSDLFKPEECLSRERAWRSVRIMDIFLASSLGRPALTSATSRAVGDRYSASIEICNILEDILNQVYARRAVSTDTVANISSEHRKYVSKLAEGIENDGIPALEFLEEAHRPNVGLVHIRDAFHITVMLLTRPFLLEAASACVEQGDGSCKYSTVGQILPGSNQVLVLACVDSAIQIIDPLPSLCLRGPTPKRWPLVVNSVFLAAMVLGLAFFANLDRCLPLDRHMDDALAVMRCLGLHDIQAKRNLGILEYLVEACREHVDRRDWVRTKSRNNMVGGLFGTQQFGIPASKDLETPERRHMRGQSAADSRLDGLVSSSTSSLEVPGMASGSNPNTARQQVDEVSHTSSAPTYPPLMDGMTDVDFPEMQNFTDNLGIYFGSEALLSPQTLCFGSYSEDVPLFSTANAR